MCLDNSRYALVFALGRNNIFATGIADTAQWERCHELLGNESSSSLQNVFPCISLVPCLI